jgi:hypothetical protein
MEQYDKIDVYLFSEDAPLSLPEQIRPNLPDGFRYLASVTGPWQVFAIVEVDQLTDLAKIIPEGLMPGGGMQMATPPDPQTVRVIGPYYLKTSRYDPASAFIRIHIGDADPETVLEAIRANLGHKEAQIVLGDFDILAYVGGEDADDVFAKIVALRKAVPAIRRTVSLQVIDYVSRSANAPPGHKAP